MEENNYCVYIHTTPSKKKYIGITKQKPQKRWRYGWGYANNVAFYNAIKKYGWENIKHEIICSNLSKQEACEMEIKLISEYKTNTKQYGYNITLGGEGTNGKPMSEETKNKIGRANKGHIVTQETRLKISKKISGENNPNYGKHRSSETKKKISKSHKGLVFSIEHRKNLSISHMGLIPANKGKPLSQEAIQKIIDSRKRKPIYCVNNNKVYSSICEASKKLGLLKSHISEICLGKRQSTKGYVFKYYKEEKMI